MYLLGAFSTHIPYIFLILLYLVGLGAYSVQSVHEKRIAHQPLSSIEMVQNMQLVSNIQHNSTYHFVNFKQKTNNAVLFKRKYKSSPKLCHSSIYNCNFYLFIPEFLLFSRPPPVIII